MELPITAQNFHEYRHVEKENVEITKLLNYKRIT